MIERTKPYLRTRVAGDPCDRKGCDRTKILIRINPKREPGIFMCWDHTDEYEKLNGSFCDN
jgi:hypothetical protein